METAIVGHQPEMQGRGIRNAGSRHQGLCFRVYGLVPLRGAGPPLCPSGFRIQGQGFVARYLCEELGHLVPVECRGTLRDNDLEFAAPRRHLLQEMLDSDAVIRSEDHLVGVYVLHRLFRV